MTPEQWEFFVRRTAHAGAIDAGKVREIIRECIGEVTTDVMYGRVVEYDKEADFFTNKISALLQAEQKPIPCSERLPTEADADYKGMVWWWSCTTEFDTEKWSLAPWFNEHCRKNTKTWTFWLPTNLKRPLEPETLCSICKATPKIRDEDWCFECRENFYEIANEPAPGGE